MSFTLLAMLEGISLSILANKSEKLIDSTLVRRGQRKIQSKQVTGWRLIKEALQLVPENPEDEAFRLQHLSKGIALLEELFDVMELKDANPKDQLRQSSGVTILRWRSLTRSFRENVAVKSLGCAGVSLKNT